LALALALAIPGAVSAQQQLFAANDPLVEPDASPSVSAAEKARRNRLTWNPSKDLPIVLATGGGWLFTEINKDSMAPATCRWCSTNVIDNSVTRALGWENRQLAATLSDVTAYGLTPLVTLGSLAFVSWDEERLDETPLN